MKKLLIISLACVLCGVLYAADNTATIQLRVTSTTDSKTDVLNLFENESYSEAFVQGEDSRKMGISDATKVYIYTVVGTEICANKGTNNLNGTEVIVKTNSSTSYRFTVPYQAGSQLYSLWDKEKETLTPINSTLSYDFTASAGQSVTGRFYVVLPFKPDPDPLAICHIGDELQINKNPFEGKIVVKDEEGEVVLEKDPFNTPQIISLKDLPKGRYTVEFNDGKEVFVISVKPDVTPAN